MNYKRLLSYMIVVLSIVSFVLFMYAYIDNRINIQYVKVQVIDGDSMHNTIIIDDLCIVQMKEYTHLKRNDIVAVKLDDEEYGMVKRLIGLPGDSVYYDGKNYFVNDEFISNDSMFNKPKHRQKPVITFLNYDEYFIAGDNYMTSYDSRIIGAINYDDIIGVVRKIIRNNKVIDIQ